MEGGQVIWLLVVVMFCVLPGDLKEYCKRDSDCSSLGGLICVKSMCEWGVCSCPRNKAAKYMGTARLYQCVPIRRVYEPCSNWQDTGVCGAPGSRCHPEAGLCRCDPGLVAVWGGERCAPYQQTTAGETCSTALGQCGLSTTATCEGPTTSATYWYNPIKYATPTCACANNRKLVLPNLFMTLNSQGLPGFVGRVEPECVRRGVGDSCFRDDDCPANAACKDGECACKPTYVPNYYKAECKSELQMNKKCGYSQINKKLYHCNGALGLICGDQCLVAQLEDDRTCVCGPSHTLQAGQCVPVGLGDVCHGDMNCKASTPHGLCVDGTCVDGEEQMRGIDGSPRVCGSLWLLLLPLLIASP